MISGLFHIGRAGLGEVHVSLLKVLERSVAPVVLECLEGLLDDMSIVFTERLRRCIAAKDEVGVVEVAVLLDDLVEIRSIFSDILHSKEQLSKRTNYSWGVRYTLELARFPQDLVHIEEALHGLKCSHKSTDLQVHKPALSVDLPAIGMAVHRACAHHAKRPANHGRNRGERNRDSAADRYNTVDKNDDRGAEPCAQYRYRKVLSISRSPLVPAPLSLIHEGRPLATIEWCQHSTIRNNRLREQRRPRRNGAALSLHNRPEQNERELEPLADAKDRGDVKHRSLRSGVGKRFKPPHRAGGQLYGCQVTTDRGRVSAMMLAINLGVVNESEATS